MKKEKKGKPCKVAVIACANKLLHHLHAILVKDEPHQDEIPYAINQAREFRDTYSSYRCRNDTICAR